MSAWYQKLFGYDLTSSSIGEEWQAEFEFIFTIKAAIHYSPVFPDLSCYRGAWKFDRINKKHNCYQKLSVLFVLLVLNDAYCISLQQLWLVAQKILVKNHTNLFGFSSLTFLQASKFTCKIQLKGTVAYTITLQLPHCAVYYLAALYTFCCRRSLAIYQIKNSIITFRICFYF